VTKTTEGTTKEIHFLTGFELSAVLDIGGENGFFPPMNG